MERCLDIRSRKGGYYIHRVHADDDDEDEMSLGSAAAAMDCFHQVACDSYELNNDIT